MTIGYAHDKAMLEKEQKKRTNLQNASLHKWCELLAEMLNDKGMDMKTVLKPDVDIPWNKQMVKEFIWRPIMQAVIQQNSTMDMSTTDPTEIIEVIARHFAQKHGVEVPHWPSNSPPMIGDEAA